MNKAEAREERKNGRLSLSRLRRGKGKFLEEENWAKNGWREILLVNRF